MLWDFEKCLFFQLRQLNFIIRGIESVHIKDVSGRIGRSKIIRSKSFDL